VFAAREFRLIKPAAPRAAANARGNHFDVLILIFYTNALEKMLLLVSLSMRAIRDKTKECNRLPITRPGLIR
jgi:hypothetical protein